MAFRQAYLDSLDASLAQLQKELDEIAAVTASFLHLSVAGLDQDAPAVRPTSPRSQRPRRFSAPQWRTDDPTRPTGPVAAGALAG